VDAECTHDGSIKHIQKFEQWGWKTLERRVLDAERTDTNLKALQVHSISLLVFRVSTLVIASLVIIARAFVCS
jgi:hypothetical protein